jgi:hypothetical protein
MGLGESRAGVGVADGSGSWGARMGGVHGWGMRGVRIGMRAPRVLISLYAR